MAQTPTFLFFLLLLLLLDRIAVLST